MILNEKPCFTVKPKQRGIELLCKHNIATHRAEDYFAETFKSDEHMKKYDMHFYKERLL